MRSNIVERALGLLYQPIGRAAARVGTSAMADCEPDIEQGIKPMGEALEKIGGSVMNLVLGALIVWVGQTTFQHAGILASVDQKFASIDKQFQDDEKRHESMRKWLENVVSDLKDSNRSQFTQKEGDQLIAQLRQVEGSAINLERKFAERLSELEIRLVALQESGQNVQEVAALAAEVTQLRYAMTQGTAPPEVHYSTAPRVAQRPTYLPPVGAQR